jgi:hypothetical protein
MPRRHEHRFSQPSVPTYDEATPRPPKPVVYTDKKGRDWLCEYLRLGEHHFGKTDNFADATHRGFTFARYGEVHQRVYRFQLGDDRSTDRATIYKQLAASKKVPGHAEHAEKLRLTRPIKVSRSERIQEHYHRLRSTTL